jgi:hypothetical protein
MIQESFQNSLPRSFGWSEGDDSNAVGFQTAESINRPFPEGLGGEEVSPQIHFTSEMFEKRPKAGSFEPQTMQNGSYVSPAWHSEALQPSLNQNSCPFPQNWAYEPTLKFNANSCPVSFKDLVPEQLSSRPNRPVPCYDNSNMLIIASSCGLDSERLSASYQKLERPDDFGDDSSYLGSWMNAVEAKNGLVVDIIGILIDAVKKHHTLLTGLRSDVEKQAGESSASQNSLDLLLSSRMEQLRGQITEESQFLISRASHELSQSFQGSIQTLKDQVSSQSEGIVKLVGSQAHSEDLARSLTGEIRTYCENLVQSLAGETQARFEKLARDASELISQQESVMNEKLRALSGEFASKADVKETFGGCEGPLRIKVNELDSKIEKIKRELSAATSADLKKLSHDLNLAKLRIEEVESSLPLARSALQPTDVEDILTRVGSDKLSIEVARLSKELQGCQNDIRTSKRETDQKLQGIPTSLKEALQKESSKQSAELSDAIMALRHELSETGEAGQRDLESRLLAHEGQLSEILNLQKDLKEELSRKATPSNIGNAQKDPKSFLTAVGLEKEFGYYKNLVDQHAISMKELGQEFRIWRKECSLLVKRFEDFCPEGCLALHKGIKTGGQSGGRSISKGTVQTSKEPHKISAKDPSGNKNNKGPKAMDRQGPQNESRQKAKNKIDESKKEQAKPKTSNHPKKSSSQRSNIQPEPTLGQTVSHKPKGGRDVNGSNSKCKGTQESQMTGRAKNDSSQKGPDGSKKAKKISGQVSNPGQTQRQEFPQKGKPKGNQIRSNPKPAGWGELRYEAQPFFHAGYQLPSWGQAQLPRMGPYPSIHPTYLGQPAYPLVGYGTYPY